jgi:hypothetical protein
MSPAPGIALFRREYLLEAGGWHPRRGIEDWDLWMRLAAHGFTVVSVPQVVFYYRRDEGGRFRGRLGNFEAFTSNFGLAMQRSSQGARKIGGRRRRRVPGEAPSPVDRSTPVRVAPVETPARGACHLALLARRSAPHYADSGGAGDLLFERVCTHDDDGRPFSTDPAALYEARDAASGTPPLGQSRLVSYMQSVERAVLRALAEVGVPLGWRARCATSAVVAWILPSPVAGVRRRRVPRHRSDGEQSRWVERTRR